MPTVWGWLLLFVVCVSLAAATVRVTYPFLAVTDPVPGGVLVVEGWAADYVIEQALAEYRRNHYVSLLVTGGPIEKGAPFSQFETFAEFGAATITRLSPETKSVYAIPATFVLKDQTYSFAIALKNWCAAHGGIPNKVNLISVGAHARRSRLLYQKALGNETKVGIIAVMDRGFNPTRWWASSQGFRSVIGEVIAYCYARLLFSPPTLAEKQGDEGITKPAGPESQASR